MSRQTKLNYEFSWVNWNVTGHRFHLTIVVLFIVLLQKMSESFHKQLDRMGNVNSFFDEFSYRMEEHFNNQFIKSLQIFGHASPQNLRTQCSFINFKQWKNLRTPRSLVNKIGNFATSKSKLLSMQSWVS